MKKIVPFITILFLAFAASGCGLSRIKPVPEDISREPAKKAAIVEPKTLTEQLYAQYQEWKGTQYRLGGLSKKGIDCSGLVYVTYREKLGIKLPRSTKYQSQIGKEINRSELRSGDLVFFKTGPKVKHVGMYLENGTFLHASTKKGVTISKLSGYYWQKKYWQARRVEM